MTASLSLVVRRVIKASQARVFEAWTTPSQLRAWWGPRGVTCNDAAVDLRVGGRYRIGNLLPDGKIIVIEGSFLVVEPHWKLVYTWSVDDGSGGSGGVRPREERVTVRFDAKNGSTEVIIVHDGIHNEPTRTTHEQGWNGCLEGLEALAT